MNINLMCGDCKDKLKELEDNSVDAVVTDPPYGLSFMGKKWDYQIPSVDIWKECLRVLKPGGHALIACGTRTQHRMVVNIEDAGFEIRDVVSWIYGSGFPKSLNISKAIDNAAGAERDIVCVAGKSGSKRYAMAGDFKGGEYNTTAPATEAAKQWDGWGTALKPACEFFTLCRKPLSEKSVAANVLKWGVGGLNIDGCRVKCDTEVIEQSGEKVDIDRGKCADGYDRPNATMFRTGKPKERGGPANEQGRFPANLIHDGSEEVTEHFPESKSTANVRYNKASENNCMSGANTGHISCGHDDKGSAARFFKQISFDNLCFLCYSPLCKDNNKENIKCQSKCKYVGNAGKNLKSTKATKENTVQLSAISIQKEKLVHFVMSVGDLCASCATLIVQEVVAIKNSVSSKEGLRVIRDFIGNSKKCILIQNLAQCVEALDNIDTTIITQNLLKLFGSANHAITNYIQETRKSEPKRFLYAAKASRKERGKGNNHPTVKPISLMKYLVRLITPKSGIVLDPFMGSGSTGVACLECACGFVGIELDEKYFEIAKSRMQQPHLF